MITCGLCGSGVSADEKFKRQQNGNEHRYVYYGCTKFNDKKCPCGYIREEDLIEQLAGILDIISLDEIGMKGKIKAEVEAHNAFQQSVLGLGKWGYVRYSSLFCVVILNALWSAWTS